MKEDAQGERGRKEGINNIKQKKNKGRIRNNGSKHKNNDKNLKKTVMMEIGMPRQKRKGMSKETSVVKCEREGSYTEGGERVTPQASWSRGDRGG